MKIIALLILSLAFIVANEAKPNSDIMEIVIKPHEVPHNSPGIFEKTQRQLLVHNIGNKHYYIEEGHEVTWFTAMHRCQEMGAHLASLQDENEYQLLISNLDHNRNYWIDINDLSHDGEYLSYTTGRKAPFLKWHPSYNPDNKGGNEHCVHLWNLGQSLGMNIAPCNLLRYFICEL